jgi:methionyl-tRNA formyltransferase
LFSIGVNNILEKSEKIILAFKHPRYKVIAKKLINLKNISIIEIDNAADLEQEITKTNPDWIFFPHWSIIIPQEIHKNFRCVVFHMTDLPYGRGGSPLQNLILHGHNETKLSAIKCVSQLDAGDIYLQRPLSLEGTAEEILQRAADIMPEMIDEIITTSPTPVPQKGKATIFARRKPHESDIAGLDSVEKIHDYIRMLDADGYPHAFLEVNKMRLEFTDSCIINGSLEAKVKISMKS